MKSLKFEHPLYILFIAFLCIANPLMAKYSVKLLTILPGMFMPFFTNGDLTGVLPMNLKINGVSRYQLMKKILQGAVIWTRSFSTFILLPTIRRSRLAVAENQGFRPQPRWLSHNRISGCL